MKHRYLEVTFRRGKALAAYLYLPRTTGAKVVRTTDEGQGIHVDYDSAGNAMGIEITSPTSVELQDLNAVLARLGQPDLPKEEWEPARAA